MQIICLNSLNFSLSSFQNAKMSIASLDKKIIMVVSFVLISLAACFYASRYFQPQTLDEQLKGFFKSTKKTQKLFTIDDQKVGLIYNPHGEAIKDGMFTVSDHIAIITTNDAEQSILDKIDAKMPKNCSYSQIAIEIFNGQSIFKHFRFE